MQSPPRTAALSVFANARPPQSKAAKDAEAWRRRAAEQATQLGLPPLFVAHIAAHAKSKAKIAQFADIYRAGCYLTGVPFTDKYNRHKNATPSAAVKRQDGTWVTYAAWLLTQEGKVPDNVLIGAAKLIAAKHAKQHQPQHQAQPTPTIAPPTQPPVQEPSYGLSSLLDMEPGHQDYSQPSDPTGYGESAEPSRRQGSWVWSDESQSVVFSPI